MEVKKTSIFKLSVAGSLALFISIFYFGKLFNIFWVLYAVVEIVIIFIYLIIVGGSIRCWIKKRTNKAYLPFLINFITAIIVIMLPLNLIRERIGFYVFKNDYNEAANLVYHNIPDPTSLYNLPSMYEPLSVSGQALIVNDKVTKIVLFYTNRGVPTGMAGFAKILEGKNTHDVLQHCYGGELKTFKDLGNNWFYIASY